MLHHFGRTETNIQPSFIGTNSTRSTSGNFTVAAIANVQAGDLLIAFAVNVNQSGVVTMYDGWTLRSSNIGTANAWWLFTKVATGTEASYGFNSTTGTVNSTVLAYRGCEPCQVQVGTTTFANSATQTGATITASYQGTLLFYSYTETSSATVTTAPSGMTQRALSSATSITSAVYELANVSQTTATGNKTIVYSASNQGAGVLVQIKTAQRQVINPLYVAQANTSVSPGATTITINKPTGTAQNDVMIAAMQSSNTGVTWSLSGWTSIYNTGGLGIFYRVAGASEGASYTFTGTTSATCQGCIATFRYCSYDTAGTAVTGIPSYPSVTTATQYELGITIGARAASSTLTQPTGMIVIFDGSGNAGNVIISYLDPVPSGTFTGVFNASGSTNTTAISLALKGLVSS